MVEKRKFYTSLHDLSPREYMYIPTGTLNVGKPGSFSKIELLHLVIAIVVLTISFAFTLSGNSVFMGFHGVASYLNAIPVVFLGLVTAFFVHELSHKFMAQKFGLWSEFRMYPFGLILAFFLAFFTGFVFATPGAVMFRGEARPSETGRIAMAGSLSNIVIASIAYVLYRFVFFETEPLGTIIGFIGLVNALLATFNLLPLGPLDGKKVLQWNSTVWVLLFSISVMFLGGMFIGGVPIPGF